MTERKPIAFKDKTGKRYPRHAAEYVDVDTPGPCYCGWFLRDKPGVEVEPVFSPEIDRLKVRGRMYVHFRNEGWWQVHPKDGYIIKKCGLEVENLIRRVKYLERKLKRLEKDQ